VRAISHFLSFLFPLLLVCSCNHPFLQSSHCI
jgi:hypothetical protein